MEGCGSTRLDSLQVVAVVAQDPGQLDAPDLGELLLPILDVTYTAQAGPTHSLEW